MFHRGSMHMRWFSTTIGLYRYPHFRQQPKKLDKKVHRCPRVCVCFLYYFTIQRGVNFCSNGDTLPTNRLLFFACARKVSESPESSHQDNFRQCLYAQGPNREAGSSPFQEVRVANFSQKQAFHDCKPSVEWYTLLTHLAAQP